VDIILQTNQQAAKCMRLSGRDELAVFKAMRVSAAYNGPFHFWQTTTLLSQVAL